MSNNNYTSVLYPTKQTLRMTQFKLWLFIVDFLGIPSTILGIMLNIDNVYSGIIAILAILYLMLRAYYYWRQKEQTLRDKEYDLWNKEMDKQERQNRHKPPNQLT